MNESKLVVIREYDSINDAEWDKSILEGEGVYSMIRNEIMSAIYPTGVMPAQLRVRLSSVPLTQDDTDGRIVFSRFLLVPSLPLHSSVVVPLVR